ncbi:MAG: hypothetical protein J2P17_25335, partial [Mycobacterium sp.]|nr:hypothetical protein [Mycobacterium sp.]
TVLSATAFAIWRQSRKVRVDHKNVNSDWEGNLTAGLESADNLAFTINTEVLETNGHTAAPNAAQPQLESAPAKTVPAHNAPMS